MTRDELLRAFETRFTHPVSARELLQALNVPRDERVGVRRQLKGLAETGALVVVRGHRYGLPDRMDVVVGRLTMHPDGFGFVRADTPNPDDIGDVYVSAYNIKDAMHGDRVTARVERRRDDGRREGRIVRILDRANAQVVGRFAVSPSGACRVVPYGGRLPDIPIREQDRGDAVNDDVVVVDIVRWPTATRPPVGHVVEVLGRLGTPGLDVAVIARKHQLPVAHGAAARAEAAAMGDGVRPADLEGRTDFRDGLVVTIDGEHARDFDDAVSVERLATGHLRLSVHIADVAHYVRPGMALDDEARERGTSVYFPERAIHMLPDALAAGLCSLRPGVDRLVQSCVMDIDGAGAVVGCVFHDGVIRSAARLTYTEVNAMLTEGGGGVDPGRAVLVEPVVRGLLEVFERLYARRRQRGAIDFDLPQADILLDAEGLIEAILPAERNIAHRIIEECMLAANETVARHLDAAGVGAVYRVHDVPDPFKVETFQAFVSGLGLSFHAHVDGVRPRDFQRLVEQMRGTPEEKPVAFLMLRTMRLAQYEAENRGHFGLALETYTHFTSPIRRYPDLVVHRCLRALRRGVPGADPADLAAMARLASDRERRAMEAERELIQWKKAEFMLDHLGGEFEGVVSGVAPFGLFVELTEHFVEGLVHLSTLVDDDYRFSPTCLQLRGRRTGQVYQLGDRLKAQVARVDRDRHQIELVITGIVAQGRRAVPPREERRERDAGGRGSRRGSAGSKGRTAGARTSRGASSRPPARDGRARDGQRRQPRQPRSRRRR